MMNRFSCPVNSNPDDRVYFFYWEDMVNYLRNEVEADGRTFRYSITAWKESAKGKKATCQMQWMRINEEGMAVMVSKTVRCEDIDLVSYVEHYEANEYRRAWKRRVFNEVKW